MYSIVFNPVQDVINTGGMYSAGAGINIDGSNVISNTGVLSAIAGTNIGVSSATGNVTISVTGTVASSVLANNLAGGAANEIPFQSAANTTTFDPSLTYNLSTSTLEVNPTSGTPLVVLNSQASTGAALQLLGASSHTNYQIDAGVITPGFLSFTPSTTLGGSTFTTPIVTISGLNGLVANTNFSAAGTVSLGGHTITLGSSFTTGSNPLTLTTTGTTNVTLPTSGTVISSVTALPGAVTGTPSSATYLRGDGTWAAPTGAGTVSSVSVVTANGFAGTVATATSTPAITLTTTITGILKGNGTAISAAVSGTDYAPATSGTSLLYGNGSGGFSNVTIGSNLSFSGGVLSNPDPGTVTSVSVVTANGFAGTVATSTSTPAITLTTSITGMLKGNGTAISAASAGTDYSAGTSALATGILKSTTSSGALSIAVAADFPTLNQNTTGNAATVTTNANLTGPITSVGNATSIASQTGTGTTFVMSNSPTLSTPNLGTPSFINLTNATSPPTWNQNTTGNAATATNISGGAANEVAFQSAPSTTSFNTNFTFNNTSGALSAPSHIATETITGSMNAGAFSYGTLGYSDVNIYASFTESVNTYAQMILQNTNSGSLASADYVVSNNNGTSTTYFGDFGMNGSGFTGSGAFSGPNNVYLTSTTADLAIGTMTSNAIHFVVNNSATDAMTIGTAGQVSFNGSAGTAGQVLTSGGASAAPTWSTPSSGFIDYVSYTFASVF